MVTLSKNNKGFSLVELIAVLVIIGVISGTVSTRLIPNKTIEIQTNRDNLLAALFHAQQRAMNRSSAIRLTTTGTSIDIRQDDDGNGIFSAAESIRVGSVSYPISLNGETSISTHSLDYNRLGETTGNTIRLTSGARFVDVAVTESGFAY